MPSRFSRREFLKSGLALAALALPPLSQRRRWDPPLPPADAASRNGYLLGRVAVPRIYLHAAPDRDAEITAYRTFDDLLILHGTAQGPGEMAHNTIWFETAAGYAYSSFIQPVDKQLNRPLLPSQVSEEQPALVEVTMPYTDVYRQPSTDGRPTYRLYYGSTHWAIAVERDAAKSSWYKLHNDLGYGYYFARAEHLHPFTPEELAPIAPGASDKRIEVNLAEQSLTAYQGNEVVLSARAATGAVFDSSDGAERDFRTPTGDFYVLRKRASRHMQGGTIGVDYYDLPGVPWVSYFTWGGIALHGTYWHNDYGRQRSHGCVNLTPEQARWLYLWTEPAVPAGEEVLDTGEAAGTPIHVVR